MNVSKDWEYLNFVFTNLSSKFFQKNFEESNFQHFVFHKFGKKSNYQHLKNGLVHYTLYQTDLDNLSPKLLDWASKLNKMLRYVRYQNLHQIEVPIYWVVQH